MPSILEELGNTYFDLTDEGQEALAMHQILLSHFPSMADTFWEDIALLSAESWANEFSKYFTEYDPRKEDIIKYNTDLSIQDTTNQYEGQMNTIESNIGRLNLGSSRADDLWNQMYSGLQNEHNQLMVNEEINIKNLHKQGRSNFYTQLMNMADLNVDEMFYDEEDD